MNLELAVQGAGIAQIAVAVVNLFLVRLLGWRSELDRMPLLIREVFQVHIWFISATLLIFGLISLKFPADLHAGAPGPGGWLAAGIGLFWALRTILQVTYYSSSHWRGFPARTAAHIVLLGVYGSFAAIYLWGCWGWFQ